MKKLNIMLLIAISGTVCAFYDVSTDPNMMARGVASSGSKPTMKQRPRKTIEADIQKLDKKIADLDKRINTTTNTQERLRLQKERSNLANQLKRYQLELDRAQ